MLKVSIHVEGPEKCGKTTLITHLKTLAVGYAMGRGEKIEVTTTERSSHNPLTKAEKQGA